MKLNSKKFEKGIKASQNGDYNEAVKILTPLAEDGNENAQYFLGVLYSEGKFVPQDTDRAVEWLTLASKQGHVKAQYDLSCLYCYVFQNYEKSMKWLKLSAEKGHVDAQHDLGLEYSGELSLPRDDNESFKWLKLAAEQGHSNAQFEIALMYSNGKSVLKDHKEAFKWFRLAAEQGHSGAQCCVGDMYEKGEGTEQNYEEAVIWYKIASKHKNELRKYIIAFRLGKIYEHIFDNINEALKWYKFSAEEGSSDAQNYIGDLYFEGISVPLDHNRAINWYKRSAENGNADAQYNLGIIYLTLVIKGIKDKTLYDRSKPSKYNPIKEEAIKFLKDASAQGHSDAQIRLGWLYKYGSGVAKNIKEWVRLIKLSAEQGNPKAQYHLALMHLNGEVEDNIYIVPINTKEGIKSLKLSAKQGFIGALKLLGHYYLTGENLIVRKDLNKAFRLHELAAKKGDFKSQKLLGDAYFFGDGVIQDYIYSHMWYNISSSNGYFESKKLRDKVSKKLSKKEIIKAQRLARDFTQNNQFFRI